MLLLWRPTFVQLISSSLIGPMLLDIFFCALRSCNWWWLRINQSPGVETKEPIPYSSTLPLAALKTNVLSGWRCGSVQSLIKWWWDPRAFACLTSKNRILVTDPVSNAIIVGLRSHDHWIMPQGTGHIWICHNICLQETHEIKKPDSRIITYWSTCMGFNWLENTRCHRHSFLWKAAAWP